MDDDDYRMFAIKRKLELMCERAESAERQVQDMKYLNAVWNKDNLVLLGELRYAHAALKRKNILVKNLRKQLEKKNDSKASEKQVDVN